MKLVFIDFERPICYSVLHTCNTRSCSLKIYQKLEGKVVKPIVINGLRVPTSGWDTHGTLGQREKRW